MLINKYLYSQLWSYFLIILTTVIPEIWEQESLMIKLVLKKQQFGQIIIWLFAAKTEIKSICPE